uniref:Uncharacterized protein n=1 Tax=Oryza brachyantha TaxID=4533 RepID=J3ND97_ORYBR
ELEIYFLIIIKVVEKIYGEKRIAKNNLPNLAQILYSLYTYRVVVLLRKIMRNSASYCT